jgi:hypothetical protein
LIRKHAIFFKGLCLLNINTDQSIANKLSLLSDGQTDRRIDGRMDRYTDGFMDKWLNRVGRWMNGQAKELTDK